MQYQIPIFSKRTDRTKVLEAAHIFKNSIQRTHSWDSPTHGCAPHRVGIEIKCFSTLLIVSFACLALRIGVDGPWKLTTFPRCWVSAGHAVEHWSALTAWCYNALGHDVEIAKNRCRRIRIDVAMSSKNLYQLGTNRKAIRDVKSFGIDLTQDLLFLQLSTWAAVVLSKFRSWSLLREPRIWLVVSCIYINVQICCQRFSSSLKLGGDPQWSIMNCNYIYIYTHIEYIIYIYIYIHYNHIYIYT